MSSGGERIVILGAGFGGLLTALKTSKRLPEANIVLIDKNDRHIYTPWLYEVVTGFLDDATKRERSSLKETASITVRDILKMNGADNVHFLKKTVKGVDPEVNHVVFDDDKTRGYDKLVIALGSEVSYFGIPGAEEYSSAVKSLDDAMQIRDKIDDCLNLDESCEVVIVGAGPTGTETAAELVNFLNKGSNESNVNTLLVDAAPTILSQMPNVLQHWTKKRLEHLGVKMWTDTMLSKATEKYAYFKPRPAKSGEPTPSSLLVGETKIRYDVLIWAGGVRPSELVKSLPLPKDEKGQIKVLPTLQVEGHPTIYAVGDVISLKDLKTDRKVPTTAWAAVREASVLAQNLAGANKQFHLPKHFPAVISVGGMYATAGLWGIPLKGRLGYAVRRIVDFNYFRKILPFMMAFRYWRKSVRVLEKND